MLNVLFITNYADMYGANQSLCNLMCILRDKYSINPYLLISGNSGEIGKFCERENITIFNHDFRISVINSSISFKYLHKFTRRVMRYYDFYKVYEYLRKQNIHFDIIHSNSSIFDIGFFLAHKWNIPHIWHIREWIKEHYNFEYVYSKKRLYHKYYESNAIITVSEELKTCILKIGHNINVVHIDDGIIIPPEYEKKFFKDNVVHFCIVGSISPSKNQLDIVKACKKLLSIGKNNFKLYIVGDTVGDYYNEIKSFIKVYSELNECIKFTGYCKDIHGFLKDKDVGIMSSTMEAFGRATVEYMANYMPVIGANSGCTPNIIGECGIIYDLNSIDQLAEGMMFYINHKQSLYKYASEIRNRAECFSAEKNATKIYQLYQSVERKWKNV